MIKYIYLVLLSFLVLISIINFNKLDKTKETKKISLNYLNSLTNTANDVHDQNIILISGDTIKMNTLKGECFFYFYSNNDCMTCVNDNIHEVINLAENTKNNLYVITTYERIHDLYLFQRKTKLKRLHLGYVQNCSITNSFFLIKFNNGEFSNSYYPIKGEEFATDKYLNKIKFLFND